MHHIASQHGALVNGYDPFMAKDSTIGPIRVDAQLRADLDRMAALQGDDVSVADVVRAALREYLARHLPPASGETGR